MKKLSFLFIASALAVSGIFAVLTTPVPTQTAYFKEVPDRPSQRGPASPDTNSSSQPNALSVRPAPGVTGNLRITENQIRRMEQSLQELRKDVSLFKDTHGWVVRFHHPSAVMSALGVKDNDVISFQQLENMKQEPALRALVVRLETVFAHLQK